MRFLKLFWILALAVWLIGCSKKADMAPGARLIQGGPVPVWSVCDASRGTLIYFTERGIAQALPLACVDGRP